MRIKILAISLLLTTAFVFNASSGFGKDKAQDFALVDINGKSFTLSDQLGKIVLLDFFATWCGPCIMEIEHLKGLYQNYSSDKLAILSISIDPESDSLRKLQVFAQQNQMEWTVARDTDNVGYKYGVSPIPHLVIVDSEGYERYSHIGLTTESTLISEIDTLISEIKNGDSGDSDSAQTGSDSNLLVLVGICGIIVLVIGVVVVKKRREKEKRIKKRYMRKHRRYEHILFTVTSENMFCSTSLLNASITTCLP